MNFPENLHYTKDHEWLKIEGNTATIGITEFAQSELGDIVYVDIDSVGKTLKAEEVFGTVEAVKTRVQNILVFCVLHIFHLTSYPADTMPHTGMQNVDPLLDWNGNAIKSIS